MSTTILGLLFTRELLVDNVALAVVALLGYMFGRRTRRALLPPPDVNLLIELARAQCVAKDLRHLTQRIRTESNCQLAAIAAFQGQIEQMQTGAALADSRQLRQCADQLVKPTMSLASALSSACDDIRNQQSQLLTFADARLDRETGLPNRRAMLDHLQTRLSTHKDGKRGLSVVVCSVDVDPYASTVDGGGDLRDVARLLQEFARDDDVVARYGPQEFVVVLSKTAQDEALVVGERILKVVDASLDRRTWAGVVEAESNESPEELLARGESALRAAAQEEESTLFLHDGTAPRLHPFEVRGVNRPAPTSSEKGVDADLAQASDE